MAPPSLDQEYAYYDKSNSAGSSGAPPTATSHVVGGQQPQEPPSQEDHQRQTQFVQKGLGARPMMQQQQDAQQQDDSRDGSAARDQQEDQENQGDATEGDDALLDLEQLEELQHEAERMKALGNKHMAAQVRGLRKFNDRPGRKGHKKISSIYCIDRGIFFILLLSFDANQTDLFETYLSIFFLIWTSPSNRNTLVHTMLIQLHFSSHLSDRVVMSSFRIGRQLCCH